MEGHRVRRQRSSTTKTKQPEPLERIQPNAAGIDCGSRHHHVAVPVDRDPEPVRRFKTFTPDLYRMVDWLEACRIDTVAMEATGVYWIPIYDILEQRGFKVVLVNARHVKNVPGRKTDVVDCQWIQELHEVGLLRGSFRPSAEIVSRRAYLPASGDTGPGGRQSHPTDAEVPGPDERPPPQRDHRHHGPDGDADRPRYRQRCDRPQRVSLPSPLPLPSLRGGDRRGPHGERPPGAGLCAPTEP